MKKICLLIVAFAMLLPLVSCACSHEWEEATCNTPKTCTLCGATEGEALVHKWKKATCTEKETCELCKKTKGKAKGHNYEDATCTEPKTCSVCGETDGEPLGHTLTEATCTEPATCSVCGEIEGKKLGHRLKAATCTDPKTCSRCGTTKGEAKGHSWQEATYSAPKTCVNCGVTEGSPLSGNSSSGNGNSGTNNNTGGSGNNVIQAADPNTGISWDGKSPIVYTYEDGTTGTEKKPGATYEVTPGVIGVVPPDLSHEPEVDLINCVHCGKLRGDGSNGTCVRYMGGANCLYCNVYVPDDTCHTCG